MSEMVERVARAMHRSWWEWADGHYVEGIPGDDACRQMSLKQARAAIEALREPATAELFPGVSAYFEVESEGRPVAHAFRSGWNAVIDAALSQDTHSLPSEDR